MDLLVNDIRKFSVQTGIVKDAIVDSVFGQKTIINTEDILLYRDGSIIIGVVEDVGYLCHWKDDATVLVYKNGEKCKVKFLEGRNCLKTIHLTSSENLSIYTMLADYHEIENIVNYTRLFNPKMKPFDFL